MPLLNRSKPAHSHPTNHESHLVSLKHQPPPDEPRVSLKHQTQLFPPSTRYKLTHSHLKIHEFVPVRCGPAKVRCCGGAYRNNNVDLSKINDVDTAGATPPVVYGMCCCAVGMDTVHIDGNIGTETVEMTLKVSRAASLPHHGHVIDTSLT